jgi:hypothetical protein
MHAWIALCVGTSIRTEEAGARHPRRPPNSTPPTSAPQRLNGDGFARLTRGPVTRTSAALARSERAPTAIPESGRRRRRRDRDGAAEDVRTMNARADHADALDPRRALTDLPASGARRKPDHRPTASPVDVRGEVVAPLGAAQAPSRSSGLTSQTCASAKGWASGLETGHYQRPEREISSYATATGCRCRAMNWTTASRAWRASRRIRITLAGILQATVVFELIRPIAKVTLTWPLPAQTATRL